MSQLLEPQKTKERRISVKKCSPGQVVEFRSGRELVTRRTNIGLDTLCRNGNAILQAHRCWSWGCGRKAISNEHELTTMRTYEPSEDLAEQKIYEALDQLLNEYGITE